MSPNEKKYQANMKHYAKPYYRLALGKELKHTAKNVIKQP